MAAMSEAGVRAPTGQTDPWQVLASPVHQAVIRESHDRSAQFGLSEADRPDYTPAGERVIREAVEKNRFLFQHAAPVMEALYGQIANTHSMVLLTARSGMILHSLGDPDFLEKASQVALMPGVDWSERCKGTNAIGTALTEEQPVVVHGAEHYLKANQFLTCSCTPIFDPYGQVIGALDVTGDHRSYHQHTMALARMSAQMIENHMFPDIFPDAVRIHFHTRAEFLGTLVEGIVVFTPDGRFLSANRSAQFQLGLSVNALKAHTFSSLFGAPVHRLHDHHRREGRQPLMLYLHNGVSVWCRLEMKAPSGLLHVGQVSAARSASASDDQPAMAQGRAEGGDLPEPAGSAAPMTASAAASAHRQPQAAAPLSSLRYLDTGDEQVSVLIRKLRMVQGRDIPIMILGETGTGKDLLARAIHNDSHRAGRNFVSVNCASIPETLIESELFGYEEGAFTGAKRKGAIGKIQHAHGGTLFLDEIGDMPRHLQARLLRVLQERRVNPLGSGKEVEVDVAVICATNRNLKDMIAKGEFREDLYYRLNGLVVRLPALRDRSDFESVTARILASVCPPGSDVRIAPEVMALLKAYRWPGNFRQLYNLLRTASVMVGCDGSIEAIHLPDDFLEEVREATRSGPVAAPAASPANDGVPQHAHSGSAIRPVAQVPVDAPVAAHPGLPIEPARPAAASAATLEDVALEAMAAALRQCRGNVSAAAKLLGVSRNTIYRKKVALPADVWH